jgi:hypothetical protein
MELTAIKRFRADNGGDALGTKQRASPPMKELHGYPNAQALSSWLAATKVGAKDDLD